MRLHESSWNFMRLEQTSETSSDFERLHKISRNFEVTWANRKTADFKTSWTSTDFVIVFKTSGYFNRFPRLHETSRLNSWCFPLGLWKIVHRMNQRCNRYRRPAVPVSVKILDRPVTGRPATGRFISFYIFCFFFNKYIQNFCSILIGSPKEHIRSISGKFAKSTITITSRNRHRCKS
jgi:hypothetical protein